MAIYVAEFEWDEKNEEHILKQHGVSPDEVEEYFFNRYKLKRKPRSSDRYYLWGQTDGGRYLFIVFQYKRRGIVRPISARNMERDERNFYLR